MGGITIPADVWQHPLVWWLILAGVAFTIVVKFGSANAVTITPLFRWWSERDARKIMRQAEIEAAALILNDQRVVALTNQVMGLVKQVQELTSELSTAHGEITSLRNEIASLRKELGDYRDEHPEL